MMDSFEFNKIAASLLVALLVGMSGTLLSDWLVNPERIEKNILNITVESSDRGAEEPKELQPITPLLASANIENGKAVFKKCAQCHTPGQGEPNKTGPNLWGIVGAKFAHISDFAYSQGLNVMSGKWDVEELNKFLHKPRDYVKGTKMSFVGIKDDKERADLIAYLQTLK